MPLLSAILQFCNPAIQNGSHTASSAGRLLSKRWPDGGQMQQNG
jgi:hypothetical protein